MPVVGGAFQPNDAGGIINMAYNRMDEFAKVKASVDNLLERGEKAKALELINTKAKQYEAGEIAHDFTTTMAEMSQYERAIRASNLDGEKKRERLYEIRKIKIKNFPAFIIVDDKGKIHASKGIDLQNYSSFNKN
jgi:hypothetical protein